MYQLKTKGENMRGVKVASAKQVLYWGLTLFFGFWSALGKGGGAEATFNLFMDRYEAQKLLGLASDIFYVREGVVNEYALNFTVKVPSNVQHLRFSWQSLTKKPIQYDMNIEYTNFFALLPPMSNISNSGKVPTKLESFRISLPCSGSINAETQVSIRFKFHVSMKHFKGPSSSPDLSASKGNMTTITLMRNKICLFQQTPPNFLEPPPPPPQPPQAAPLPPQQPPQPPPLLQPPQQPKTAPSPDDATHKFETSYAYNKPPVQVPNKEVVITNPYFDNTFINVRPTKNPNNIAPNPPISTGSSSSSSSTPTNTTMIFLQQPTPSLLLAGLLGGCAVTASIVFLIFFVFLKRKLLSPASSGPPGVVILNSDGNCSSNNSSPACLLRQSAVMIGGHQGDGKWYGRGEDEYSDIIEKQKYGNNNNNHKESATLGSRNSYVTIASFWHDLFGGGGASTGQRTRTGNSASGGSSSGGSLGFGPHGYRTSLLNGQHVATYSNTQGPPVPLPAYGGPGGTSSFLGQQQNNKGSDVSPYAYAHIVPKVAPPGAGPKAPPPPVPQQGAHPEWYSPDLGNGGHVFTNNLYKFHQINQGGNSSGYHSHFSANSSPAVVPKNRMNSREPRRKVVEKIDTLSSSSSDDTDLFNYESLEGSPRRGEPAPEPAPGGGGSGGNSSGAGGAGGGVLCSTYRSTGSGSLIQIDGFQCRKNLIKDKDVVERFL